MSNDRSHRQFIKSSGDCPSRTFPTDFYRLTVPLFIAIFVSCDSSNDKAINEGDVWADRYVNEWIVTEASVTDEFNDKVLKKLYSTVIRKYPDSLKQIVKNIEDIFIGREYNILPDGNCTIQKNTDTTFAKWEYFSDSSYYSVYFLRGKAENNSKVIEKWDIIQPPRLDTMHRCLFATVFSYFNGTTVTEKGIMLAVTLVPKDTIMQFNKSIYKSTYIDRRADKHFLPK